MCCLFRKFISSFIWGEVFVTWRPVDLKFDRAVVCISVSLIEGLLVVLKLFSCILDVIEEEMGWVRFLISECLLSNCFHRSTVKWLSSL